jgi:murein DD-endopeptidase MepM/ murein hydrolase activator NlpD
VIRTLAITTGALAIVLAGGTAAAGTALVAGATPSGFVKPVNGAVISQGFGCTDISFEPRNPGCPGGHWHSGIDLAVGLGTPVYAALPGIARVVLSATGYGLHVVIDHGGGLSSVYGHLSSVAISDGASVGAGQVIGGVGSSGSSTGPHLHFEIRRDGIAEDPRGDMTLP